MKIISIIIFVITFISVSAFPVSVSAQLSPLLPSCATGSGNCTICDIAQIFVNWANFVAGGVGAFALLFFVLGGMYWVLSAGNEERITKGRKMMVGSIIGVAIVFLAWVTVAVVIHTLVGGEKFGGETSHTLFSSDPQEWNKVECAATTATDCAGAAVGTACISGSNKTNMLCWWSGVNQSPSRVCGDKYKKDGQEVTASCSCMSYCEYYAETNSSYVGYDCRDIANDRNEYVWIENACPDDNLTCSKRKD